MSFQGFWHVEWAPWWSTIFRNSTLTASVRTPASLQLYFLKRSCWPERRPHWASEPPSPGLQLYKSSFLEEYLPVVLTLNGEWPQCNNKSEAKYYNHNKVGPFSVQTTNKKLDSISCNCHFISIGLFFIIALNIYPKSYILVIKIKIPFFHKILIISMYLMWNCASCSLEAFPSLYE